MQDEYETMGERVGLTAVQVKEWKQSVRRKASETRKFEAKTEGRVLTKKRILASHVNTFVAESVCQCKLGALAAPPTRHIVEWARPDLWHPPLEHRCLYDMLNATSKAVGITVENVMREVRTKGVDTTRYDAVLAQPKVETDAELERLWSRVAINREKAQI